ncbi:SGNH/GDSL hydrolase family protein [Spiroplasma endosymbiont of Zeiraphera isertana]|uniref:SGNH/GDSL hydrolase family protein n=1 Tax=Spiroplasma endosymbiont of Zeiraphera isertana TaxID=3066313 RepID=UPI00313CB913
MKSELYVLGDSLSDNGNLANIFTYDTWNIDKVKFQEPFYHNSFTNGDVAASILEKKLGTELLPAWYQKGNNYAVGGAQEGQNHSWEYQLFLNHYSIDHQANQLLKDHKIQNNDDIFIEIGGNDLLSAMDENSTAKQKSIINNAITTEFETVDTLINAGAQNLIIANVPNISNIPKYVNEKQSVKEVANHLSNEYNNKWNDKITELMKNNSDINIRPFDLETNFSDLLSEAQEIGKNITNESIKWSIPGLALNLNPRYIDGTTPETINNIFFFDYVHPNKWAHDQIGLELFTELTS